MRCLSNQGAFAHGLLSRLAGASNKIAEGIFSVTLVHAYLGLSVRETGLWSFTKSFHPRLDQSGQYLLQPHNLKKLMCIYSYIFVD